MTHRDTFKSLLHRSAEVKTTLANDSKLMQSCSLAAEKLLATARSGGTIFTCGNGGSACDAMHFTEELVARYKRERPGIKAMHLMDPGIMTCWANDYDYQTVFKRQIETFGARGDTLVGFSTSGNSGNVLAAIRAAKERGMVTIGMGGKDGGELAKICDIPIVIPANETERIQECHITLVHIFCEILETTPK